MAIVASLSFQAIKESYYQIHEPLPGFVVKSNLDVGHSSSVRKEEL